MYHQPRPWNWFLKRPGYIRFMLRELTAVFIGGYLIFVLILLSRLGAGQEGFVQLLGALRSGLAMALHMVVLIAALTHTITWFNLTPKAMPLFLGEKRVASPLVSLGMGYVPWIVVTVVIIWGVLG